MNSPSVRELVELARKLHVSMVKSYDDSGKTAGSCLYACILLRNMFEQFRPELVVQIKGGDGKQDGGYRDAKNTLHGHYWLELEFNGTVFVCDITADQFGAEGVVIVPAEETDSYLAGDQDIIDRHVDETIKDMNLA